MTCRVLVAFFSGIIGLITTSLIPAAYFGDKNEAWTKRLIIIAFVAAMVFLNRRVLVRTVFGRLQALI
jgi:predicted membrane channel-forming protein YqfA (hemolysin III family)